GQRRLRQQAVDDGDQEGQGLAGTGLGLAGDVAPGESDRQGQRLDRRAAGEPGGLQAGQQQRVQLEAGEGDIGKWLIAHVWDLVCGASTCRVLRSDSRSAWVAAMRGDSPLCGDPNGQGIRSSCMTRSGACVGGARIADCLGNGMAPSGAVPGNSRTMAAWGRPGFFRTVALIRAANRPSLASIRGRLAGPPPCPRSLSVSEHVIHATDADFDATVLQSAEPVLVDFWAPWCGPCKMIAPALDELAGEYAGKVKIAK